MFNSAETFKFIDVFIATQILPPLLRKSIFLPAACRLVRNGHFNYALTNHPGDQVIQIAPRALFAQNSDLVK